MSDKTEAVRKWKWMFIELALIHVRSVMPELPEKHVRARVDVVTTNLEGMWDTRELERLSQWP